MPPARRSPAHLALQRILLQRRQAAGLSQAALAERLARPQSYVAKIEVGERRLDVPELLELASGLGCSAEDIVAELVRAGTVKPAKRSPATRPKTKPGRNTKSG